MQIKRFALEDFFTEHEFSAKYLLTCSDAEAFSIADILNFASPLEKDMFLNLRLGYTMQWGDEDLRRMIAEYFYEPLQMDDILCFAGAQEGIFLTLWSLCKPNDHVIVITPAYQSLSEVPKMAGAEVSELDLESKNDWKLDVEKIAELVNSRTKGIVINFPHNPTGQVLSEKNASDLISLCQKYDLWLFSDEVYRFLGDLTEEGVSISFAARYNRAISLGVTSKSFGLAGLRIGWIACQDRKILADAQVLKNYSSISNSAPSEVLTKIVLKNKDYFLQRNNRIRNENFLLFEQFFKKFPTLFSWSKPVGGCIGLVEYKKAESCDAFCQEVLSESGVLLLPGSVFGTRFSNFFRVGFGRSDCASVLNRLELFLQRSNHE